MGENISHKMNRSIYSDIGKCSKQKNVYSVIIFEFIQMSVSRANPFVYSLRPRAFLEPVVAF